MVKRNDVIGFMYGRRATVSTRKLVHTTHLLLESTLGSVRSEEFSVEFEKNSSIYTKI